MNLANTYIGSVLVLMSGIAIGMWTMLRVLGFRWPSVHWQWLGLFCLGAVQGISLIARALP